MSLPTAPAVPAFSLGDQSTIGWSRKFVYELAMRLASVRQVCEAHGVTQDEWLAIRANPVFVADLQRATDALKEEGASFRVKAGLIAEDALDQVYALINSGDVEPSVKRNLIRDVVKHAGLDASRDQDAQAAAMGAPKVAVQITLA